MKTIENRNETLMINNITNLNNTTLDIVKQQNTNKTRRDTYEHSWWTHNIYDIVTGLKQVMVPYVSPLDC